ncbi:MAG: sulfatase family protein [Actinomycetota bacterium]
MGTGERATTTAETTRDERSDRLPRRSRRPSIAAVLASAMVLAAVQAIGSSIPSTAAPTTPNIVLILTDDQRWDQMDYMPTVRSGLAQKGRTFTEGFVVNPLCCPSRATILSGQYSHGTGVYTNSDYSKFRPREGSTIATWLDAAGYRTGLVGKYLNGYGKGRATSVLPGWDTWRAFVQPPGYFNYSLSIDGVPTPFGSDAASYSTDVLAGYATEFIRSVPAEEPLFLWFGPNAPHNPYTPAPRHKTSLPNFTAPIYPNVNEADVSDKPAYVRRLSAKGNSINSRRKQAQTLLAVDEAVGQIITALSDTDRLSTTFILFMSDNGLSHRSHRWSGKESPWDEAAHVPFIVRYDPVTAGTPATDDRLVLNLDVAPTFAALAGVGAPGAEGTSILPLLDGSASGWRTAFALEHVAQGDPPTYCAIRTTTHKYIRYSTGEEELYDLVADPFELQSRHADPASAALKAQLRAQLQALCSPPPPGYSF